MKNLKRSTLLLCLAFWSASLATAYFMGSLSKKPSVTISPVPKAAASVKETRIAEPIEIAVLPAASTSELEVDVAGEAEPPEEVLDEVSTRSNESTWEKLDDAFALPISDVKRSGQIIELLGLLAETDPVAALELGSSLQTLRDKSRARNSVFEVWGRNDPAAAIAWLTTGLEGEPKAVRNTLLSALFRGYAESNPAAAFEEALTISDKKLLQSLLRDVVKTQIASGGIREARKAVDLLPDTRTRNSLRLEIVDEWAGFDPRAAADYVTGLGNDAMPPLKRALLKKWAQSDPAAAAAWLSDLPEDDPAISIASTQIIVAWTRYDIEGPTEWLNSLPATTTFDQARMSYAFRAAEENPRVALAWSESILGDNRRKWSKEQVTNIWRMRDPEGFKSYVDSVELTEE
jgi:hypothetical protein